MEEIFERIYEAYSKWILHDYEYMYPELMLKKKWELATIAQGGTV